MRGPVKLRLCAGSFRANSAAVTPKADIVAICKTELLGGDVVASDFNVCESSVEGLVDGIAGVAGRIANVLANLLGAVLDVTSRLARLVVGAVGSVLETVLDIVTGVVDDLAHVDVDACFICQVFQIELADTGVGHVDVEEEELLVSDTGESGGEQGANAANDH